MNNSDINAFEHKNRKVKITKYFLLHDPMSWGIEKL